MSPLKTSIVIVLALVVVFGGGYAIGTATRNNANVFRKCLASYESTTWYMGVNGMMTPMTSTQCTAYSRELYLTIDGDSRTFNIGVL